MRRINAVLVDEAEAIFEEYKKENSSNSIDEALNNLIKEFKDLQTARVGKKRK